MESDAIKDLVSNAIDDLKGQDIKCLFVGDITSVSDWMVIASGTSNRHVKSIADNVAMQAKAENLTLLGREGEETAEWVLLDYGSVVVHLMLPDTRRFYDLESLWGVKPSAQVELDSDL